MGRSRNRLGLLLPLALPLVACEGNLGPLPTDPGSEGASVGSDGGFHADGTPLTGEELFNENCRVCHGPEGTGATIWTGVIQGYEPINTMVTNGRGDMDPVDLSSSEIAAIQEYLLSFDAPDWSVLSGVELFQTACSSCHGSEALGTDRGFQLRFRDDDYFSYVLRKGRQSTTFDSDMEAYDSSRITEAQVTEMLEWIDSFPNATTGAGLYEQFCANCHGKDGRSGRAGKNIREEKIANVVREGKEDSVSNKEYMPGWTTSEISEAELSLIDDYLSSL